ncbi:MAG: MarR family winged helix-turn-helix transcriptional regulator [Flavobacteriales bacterium]
MNEDPFQKFNPRVCISGQVMRLNRIIANVFRKYLKPFGITDSQLTILFILCKKNELNQKKLTEITKHEKSSLNRNLNRLIDMEFVTKVNFPLIQITEKGKTKVLEIIPEWEKAMKEVNELIEDEGVDALNLIMNKL